MVSVPWSMAGRESALGLLARWARRRSRELRAFLVVALRFALVVAGLALLTVAAWSASRVAGYAMAGVSCLVLEYVVKRR